MAFGHNYFLGFAGDIADPPPSTDFANSKRPTIGWIKSAGFGS
jgi:hypothetical protein